MANKTDQNGLPLSNLSDSGYAGVTTFVGNPNFYAFVNVPEDLQADLADYRKVNGTIEMGHVNVFVIRACDDVRDAAHIAISVHGPDIATRDKNLADIFSGDDSSIPTQCPDWKFGANYASVNAASTRALKRAAAKLSQAAVPSHKSLAAIRNDVVKKFPKAEKKQINKAVGLIVTEKVETWGEVEATVFAGASTPVEDAETSFAS